VPNLPHDLLYSVVFLYQTPNDAEHGKPTGGTGCLVGLPWESDSAHHHIYVVSNRHVAIDSGASVVRLNTKAGSTEILDFTPDEWTKHEQGADLAVVPIKPSDEHQWMFHSTGDFLSQSRIDEHGIGIGDDVFSVGRFVDIAEQRQNRPVVRFGNIALMPPENIDGEDVLLVEMRSRSGYSGSPIFVYVSPTHVRFLSQLMRETRRTYDTMLSTEMYGPWILGIQKGQLNAVGPEISEESGSQTGMTTVVPIQKLVELLDMVELKDKRQSIERGTS
jgi:hypothetical protein